LILDISNNEEYIWTTSFEPPSPVPSSTNIPKTQPSGKINTPTSPLLGVIAGTVVGSLIGGILLTIGVILFYRQYKNKKERKVPTSMRNIYFQEILQISRQKVICQQEIDDF
jgi:hypothetical protein